MELRQLRSFVRVVELGSMSHAARDLNLVQSAPSQQISRLEGELAAQLQGEPLILPTGPHGLRSTLDAAFARARVAPSVVLGIDSPAALATRVVLLDCARGLVRSGAWLGASRSAD
jgi:LysR family transcriptional regulator, regulatory protein for tcuABC